MARPWYSFYPSDYARDTGHLTLIEHGAYRMLMDHYYATAAPLPRDHKRLLRLCRAQAAVEREAVRFVLGQFFSLGADGYRHRRIDAEIEKAAELAANGSIGGKISAARRKRTAKPTPSKSSSQVQASQSQSQPPSQKKYKSGTPGFEEFWKAYPRREARALARAAYATALESAAPETLIAAAAAYAARREGQDALFTKLAANWLAQECWLDDVTAGGGVAADEPALRAAWDGQAAPLVEEIGAAAFQAFFGAAEFATGPPARITVGAAYLRDLIERKFTPAMQRAYGEVTLEVAA